VMSLVKIAPSSWSYYASEVADGREDYYREAEVPGRFLGRGAGALGIASEAVTAEGLERLFGKGADPRDGRPLGRGFAEKDPHRVAGFAVTFSPPKSVSVLWALGSDAGHQAVLEAHRVAVEEAFGFLEDHAAYTRRGRGGVHQVDTEGFVAAAFTHRTSRAADPQLHTHVLIANKVRADDGAWLAVDARELFAHQRAAGMLYKSALRAELTRTLGLGWTEVGEKGIAEVRGVPEALAVHWSTRRREVEELARQLIAEKEAARGHSLSANGRAACFQVAAYRTRAPKAGADIPTDELRARWASEAEEWGFSPERWTCEVRRGGRAVPTLSAPELLRAAIDRLEDGAATWTRAEAVEVLSTLVTGERAAEVRQRVERLADRLLRHPEVASLAAPLPAAPPEALRRRDGMAVIERHGATRFSTKDTLGREAFVFEAAERGRDAGIAVVAGRPLDKALRRAGLGADQERAVRALVAGGDQIFCLVGPAGAGKSRSLDAARAAWERAGYRPIGLAPSAMAAGVLAESAGLSSETLAKFLLKHGRLSDGAQLDERSVVILDEAAMARTDDLARLVAAVIDARAKLVLVGDPDQLGAVGPGGVFRTLVRDDPSPELETVRRFSHAWEAAASLRLRAGDPSILAVYERHGRLESGTREEMLDAAFSTWRRARDEGSPVLLMAGDNATADEFARRCQADRVGRGEVERANVAIASGAVGIGDEIVTLRNDRRIRSDAGDFVRNGERFAVTARGEDGSLTVISLDGRALDRNSSMVLPPSYVSNHVALGYALTIHKAQGATTRRAIVLVDEQTTRPQLYVAMTRGREENRVLVVTEQSQDEHELPRETPPLEVLESILRHQGGDRSAHDVLAASLARLEDRTLLRDLVVEARRRVDDLAGPDRSAGIAALTECADVDAAEGRLRLAEIAVKRAEKEHRSSTRTWNELHHARYGVRKAHEARSELDALTVDQDRRAAWIEEHPSEVGWVNELEARLSEAEQNYQSLVAERESTRESWTSSEEGGNVAVAGSRTGRQGQRTVEEEWSVERDHAGYVEAPQTLPPTAGPGGPTLTP